MSASKQFHWCKVCQKVQPVDKLASGGDCTVLACGHFVQAPDKRVPNVFPKGRGF